MQYNYSSKIEGSSLNRDRDFPYPCGLSARPRGGLTGAVQLKQLASDYSQQKHTTWAGRGRIIIV